MTATVGYTATSPYGGVREMRTARGRLSEAEMASRPWEPLVAVKQYTVTPPVSLFPFVASVQYRDTQGHLSLVYWGTSWWKDLIARRQHLSRVLWT